MSLTNDVVTNYFITPPGAAASAIGIWSDLVKSLVAPAVVAVFFTGFTNYGLERLKSRRESITGLSIALRAELSELQTVAAEYWSNGAAANDALREARIMSGLEAISTGLRSFQRERKIKLAADLDGWLVELRDQLTSGGFQTHDRAADFPRLQAAATQLSRMRYRVFEERLKHL